MKSELNGRVLGQLRAADREARRGARRPEDADQQVRRAIRHLAVQREVGRTG